MMNSLTLIFVTSFLIALSGALMPGPMLTVTIADASEKGEWVGPLIVLGHGMLEAILIGLVLAGLGPFLTRPIIVGPISLSGGILLGWLGFDMVRRSSRMHLIQDRKEGGPQGNSVVHGILTSLSNPYWTLWWATIGLGYLGAASKFGGKGVLVFFTGHILADLGWYSTVSFAVGRGKRILGETLYRRLILGCGLFLIFFGLWFLQFGWSSLVRH
jgi:threonine/homoserine/homoserine lactone efflux protein